ncbi:MAG: sodium/proline symporter [Lachnospiraceae bacterium]|nr:sodium/proline symporter [Lachnospiraceae bacterium]
MTGIVVAIVLYLLLMIGIGVYYGKKGDSSSEGFYLGGRKLGPLVAAMSAEASDMSSYLLMGLPGLAYLTGLCDVGWTAIGLAVGTYLNWLFVAKRLRKYSYKIGAFTVPDFFSKRYKDEKNILTCIAAIVIIIFFIPYTASGFKAVGTLFNTLFGVDYHVAMIVGAVIIVLYTILGGFLAVSTTDLIQSIVMTIALIVMVFYGINIAGGWDAVVDNARALPGFLSFSSTYDPASGTAAGYGPITVLSTLAWGLGYFGMPHILLRFMASKNEEQIKTSRRIASIWVAVSMFVAILIGIIGNAVSKTGMIETFTDSSSSETIIIALSMILSEHGFFIALVAGLALAGILASTMSTADSQLLAAASAVSQNLIQDFAGKKLKDKTSMIAARSTVAAIALIALFLAWNPNSSVFTIVSFAWAGFGGAFGPVMLFALFWKRSNLKGAIAGMVSGGVMIFVWKYLVRPIGGAWNIYELLPAFIVGSIAIVVVSLLTEAPSREIIEEFESIGE